MARIITVGLFFFIFVPKIFRFGCKQMVRWIGVGVVSGACLVHQLAALPALGSLWPGAGIVAACALFSTFVARLLGFRSTSELWLRRVLWCVLSLQLSLCWTVYSAQVRLTDILDPHHENEVTRLTFRVNSMRQERDQVQTFQATVLEPVIPGIPRHIQVLWRDPASRSAVPAKRDAESHQDLADRVLVLPGQVWRAALVLRRPHGTSNPSGFDYEGLMFQRNIRAIGKVRGTPVLIRDDGLASFAIAVDRFRHHVRAAMQRLLKDARYGAVMIALAIGDQDGVRQEDWEVFNKTGITHLVSISGSHVTMIGALGGLLALWGLKRFRWRGRPFCQTRPARPIAATIAMLVAFLYCLLAGWGVPARRTFLMLAVTASVLILNLPFSPARVLLTAAAAVTLLDPWSTLSTGFWLSFVAVGVLFSVATSPGVNRFHASRLAVMTAQLKDACRLQWIITLAMLPVLAYLFQQVSLSSPFANAVAIPVMTFLVTPLALLTALLALMPGLGWLAGCFAWIGHEALVWMMHPVQWLATASWAMQDVSAFPIALLVISVAGICWSMQPPGMALRWAGWLCMMPALFWQPSRPGVGSFTLLAFDVGQGAAILIMTANHQVLYDTGPKLGSSDSAKRVLLPVFRALGVRHLDWLIVSHGDLDHAGGLKSILDSMQVERLLTSAGVEQHLGGREGAPVSRYPLNQQCDDSQHRELDGVRFQILNSPVDQENTSSNSRSCILKIEGAHHRVLLPGDIGVRQEVQLLARQDVSSDIVILPHHGSRTSSSDPFVVATKPKHVVAQVGYLNRFRHPDPVVSSKWARAGARVWRSDRHGAMLFESGPTGLKVQAWRQVIRRYWHHDVWGPSGR